MSVFTAYRVIAERRSVDVIEIRSNEVERVVQVVVPGKGPAEIVLPSGYQPSIALLRNTIAVWAGARLYLMADGKAPIRADFEDEVHAVYAIGERFCVVGELSVFLFEAETGTIIDRYEAQDILGASWWDGDRLMVERAIGGTYVFQPSNELIRFEKQVPRL